MKNGLTLAASEQPPALQPEHLAAGAADAVREILAEAASANTTRSWDSADIRAKMTHRL